MNKVQLNTGWRLHNKIESLKKDIFNLQEWLDFAQDPQTEISVRLYAQINNGPGGKGIGLHGMDRATIDATVSFEIKALEQEIDTLEAELAAL